MLELPTDCEAKISDEGEKAATLASPVPLRLTGAGLLLLLLVNDRDPVRLPRAVGLKTTLMVQLVPALSDVPQLLVWLKSPAAVRAEMESAIFPLLVSVTACDAVDVPTVCAPKASDEGESAATAANPVPVRLTGAGAVLLLLVNDSDPVRLPTVVGLKTTLIVQLAPGSSEAAQVLVCVKSPVMLMALMESATLPVLLRVTLCAALLVPRSCEEKLSDPGESVATAAVPVPLSVTAAGAGLLLLLSVSEPLRFPMVVGVKTRLMVQLAPAATEVPQLLLWLKSPLAAMLVTERGAVPLLLSVTDWAALLVLTACAAKASEAGENTATGTVPVPVMEIEDEAGVPLLVTMSEPVRLPVAVGAKLTLMVHEAPTANEVAQLLAWAKSPEALIWPMVNVPSPLLVSVTAWVALLVPTICAANVSDDGDRLATGMTPVPERPMLGGPPVKLPCAVMVPLREPSAVGVNVTVSVHEVFGVIDAGQLLVWAKSPVTTKPVRFKLVLPVLKKNSDFPALIQPTAWLLKESVEGLNRP